MREIRARHLMVPLLPDSSWEFDGTFVPSEAAGPLVFSTNVTLEAFSVKRLPGSRTSRDLMITSGKGLFKGSIVLLSLRIRACSGATCSNWTVSLVYSFLAFSVVWHCCSVRCVSCCFTATDIPIASSGVTVVALTVTIPLTIAFLVDVTTSITASISVVAVSGTACPPAPVAAGHDCRSLFCGLPFRHPEYDPDRSRGKSVSSLSAFLSTS